MEYICSGDPRGCHMTNLNTMVGKSGKINTMTMHNQIIGKLGEDAVLQAALQKGYQQIGRNIRTPFGEIDLILMQDNTLVFTEVKTRTGDKYGYPEEAVSKLKLRHMIQSSEHYIQKNNLPNPWRLDVVAVIYDLRLQKTTDIEWMENVTADL